MQLQLTLQLTKQQHQQQLQQLVPVQHQHKLLMQLQVQLVQQLHLIRLTIATLGQSLLTRRWTTTATPC